MSATADLTAEHLLERAEAMSEGVDGTTASYWARGSALLARMALESAVTALVAPLDPDLADASMASKLLLLRTRTDEETVQAAQRAWAGLSRACHQHPYELAPNRGEIVDLIGAARQVVSAAEPKRP